MKNINKIKESGLKGLPYLIFIALAFALFSNTFFSLWVMDDHVVVERNQDIRSWTSFMADSYKGRPVRELTYLVDYHFFGLKSKWYHIQNILWHGLNALLIYLLALKLTGSRLLAWGSGFLFLTHPLTVEVVANISHRKDSLSLAFSLLAVLAFMHVYEQKHKWIWVLITILLTSIAYLSKQNAIGVLLVFVAYDAVYQDKSLRLVFRKRMVNYVLAGLGVVVSIAWYCIAWQSTAFKANITKGLAKMGASTAHPLPDFLKITFKATSFIFKRLFYPQDLAMEYVFPVPSAWTDPSVISGIGILVSCVVFLVLSYKYSKPYFLCFTFFIATWLPASNLIWPLTYLAADRYMYAPLAGLVIIVCSLLFKIFRNNQKIFFAAIVLICSVFSFLTWQQNKTWASDYAMATQVIKVSPQSQRSLKVLGKAHRSRFEFHKAIDYFERASQIPGDSEPFFLLAVTYEITGNKSKAIAYYKKFIDTNDPYAHSQIRKAKSHLMKEYGIRY